jgi:hypothetical protein
MEDGERRRRRWWRSKETCSCLSPIYLAVHVDRSAENGKGRFFFLAKAEEKFVSKLALGIHFLFQNSFLKPFLFQVDRQEHIFFLRDVDHLLVIMKGIIDWLMTKPMMLSWSFQIKLSTPRF